MRRVDGLTEDQLIDYLDEIIFRSLCPWQFVWGNNTTTLSDGFVGQKVLNNIDWNSRINEISDRILNGRTQPDVDNLNVTLNSFCLYMNENRENITPSQWARLLLAAAKHRHHLAQFMQELIDREVGTTAN